MTTLLSRCPLSRLVVPAALAAVAPACTSSTPQTATSDCTHQLAPGADDQTAVQTLFIDAAEGSTICLAAGTYHFKTELSITKSDITVRGAGADKTVFDFSGQDLGANGWQITGDRLTIEGLSVVDTPGDGIRATLVHDVTFRDVTVGWSTPASLDNGAYGLYPVGCDGVVVDRCTVYGSRDAGIYVGQSRRILVADSEAYGNVAGIELENSTEAEVVRAHAHDNTGGLLVFNLPGLPVFGGDRALIRDSVIENNNLPTFAVEGTIVSMVPKGIGVVLLAADRNELTSNTIRGNESAGMLMLSYLEFYFGKPNDPEFEPFTTENFIHGNDFTDNGDKPAVIVAQVVGKKPVPDVVWDGCLPEGGAGPNCMQDNGSATYINADLCGTVGHTDEDISKVTCSYAPVPPQAL